jgi:anti-anti-sigma factor
VKVDRAGKDPGDRLSILEARTRWVTPEFVAVQLNGEIDLSNSSQVAGLADDLDGSASVILDLSGVSFLGAAGLTALLRLRAQLSSANRRLVLTGTDHRPVRLPLTICRLDSILDQSSARAARSEKYTS